MDQTSHYGGRTRIKREYVNLLCAQRGGFLGAGQKGAVQKGADKRVLDKMVRQTKSCGGKKGARNGANVLYFSSI